MLVVVRADLRVSGAPGSRSRGRRVVFCVVACAVAVAESKPLCVLVRHLLISSLSACSFAAASLVVRRLEITAHFSYFGQIIRGA